ncbi:hypothetical protein MBEBAB_1602 [Brevundimonas abyssalis TAR-001]|jgi:hypothetical protein|uniref:Uncharacterized protein n=1 Tax=Brevundimonas abyssalis TAR-001 TaxID=1391729 RepID=A0A8E0NBL5_9CAUL|nr:hypothetical protein MBEBAB_1602 [Brevundimonas abyssalis TAR-001]
MLLMLLMLFIILRSNVTTISAYREHTVTLSLQADPWDR